jgi:myo-inositol-1(or 4)-monophosphatase
VSDVDLAIEEAFTARLGRAFPHHGFLCEEGGAARGSSTRWIVDPVDGTLNFLAGLPFFSISIALEHRGRLQLGVV